VPDSVSTTNIVAFTDDASHGGHDASHDAWCGNDDGDGHPAAGDAGWYDDGSACHDDGSACRDDGSACRDDADILRASFDSFPVDSCFFLY
jgi:hypothetical protein